MLDFEIKKHTKFQYNWSISFWDINFFNLFNIQESDYGQNIFLSWKPYLKLLCMFWNLYRNFFNLLLQNLMRMERNTESNGKLPHLFIRNKTAT